MSEEIISNSKNEFIKNHLKSSNHKICKKMNKLDQVFPGVEPGLHMYEPDAFATVANLTLTTRNEI